MEFLNADYDDAQYNFELVLSGDIPDEVRHNVAIFLDQINQRRHLHLLVLGGVGAVDQRQQRHLGQPGLDLRRAGHSLGQRSPAERGRLGDDRQ